MANTTIIRPTKPTSTYSQPAITPPPRASRAGAFGSRSVFARSWAIPAASVPGIPGMPVANRSGPPDLTRPSTPVTLPPLSDTVARAAALAGNPDASLADFADLVRGDPAVAALLLKRANSAAVGASTADVRQAVTLLGLKACSQIAASIGVRNLLRHVPPAVAARCEEILRHCILVASLATQLNKIAGTGFTGDEFVGGLLHDIGRVLLAMKRPDDMAIADPLDFDEPMDRLSRERAILTTDHCAAGAEFASTSKLPAGVVRAVLKHHEPFDETGEHRRLVALVSMADHLGNHLQRTRRVADYEPWTGYGYAILGEKWSAADHDRFRQRLPAATVAAVRETRMTLRDDD